MGQWSRLKVLFGVCSLEPAAVGAAHAWTPLCRFLLSLLTAQTTSIQVVCLLRNLELLLRIHRQRVAERQTSLFGTGTCISSNLACNPQDWRLVLAVMRTVAADVSILSFGGECLCLACNTVYFLHAQLVCQDAKHCIRPFKACRLSALS